ncbi:MAG: RNA polymerase sigma-54 factor [Rhodobacterales bacterium]|nr:RNA polymerase sigma-54 factor [Rhodobacterales bacterium]
MKPGNRISVQQTQRLALTTGLAASIQVLRADSEGLSRYLEEQAAENPALVLSRPNPVEWTPRWKSVLGTGGEPPEAEAPAASLVSHALALVEALGLSAADGRIAHALVDALEPSGWLGRTLASIAQSVAASLQDVESVLERLQVRAEPSGLFARSLAECLRLQAVDAGDLDPVMIIVLNRLDLVARGDVHRLAREAGVDEATVLARIGTLRGYDPKPGSRFEPFAASAREPDLIAEKGEAGWTVALNRSALPTLTVPDGRGTGRAGARALVRMVEGRNATLLSVGQEILHRQVAALEQGPGALVAMTMSDVATSLGLSESTVSRVVAGAAVDTPRGTWWLRALFTQSLHQGGLSAGALRDRLARLVRAEDPAAPLPDEALAAALADEGGAPIARRTVAKYRVQLGIPPAHRRRQRR